MKAKRRRIKEWLLWSLITVAIIILGNVPALMAGEIGKTVDKTNVSEYKDVLPPALYRAVERGDYILPTANLSFPFKHEAGFLAAGEKNAGKFDIDKEGKLIEKSTGKWPQKNVYGFPFPHIDAKDPSAGAKLMWNFKFVRYHTMGAFSKGIVYWVDAVKGVERSMRTSGSYYLFYQGRPPGQELKSPSGFLYQYVVAYDSPMSVKGMNSMNWEYWDDRDNTVYSYVPVIRRVRQSSGASRSDSTMGGDSWADLNCMWDGKNQTMNWKLVGEQTILVAFTDITKGVATEEPDGTVTRRLPGVKFGHNTKGWKGAQWAPTSCTWVPRQVWIVEQMPKDPYYLRGLHVNYVDKETCVIWHKEVWDKAGQFRTWIIAPRNYSEAPSGKNDIGEVDSYVMTDEKARHATMSEGAPPHKIFMPVSKVSPKIFTLSNFLQISK